MDTNLKTQVQAIQARLAAVAPDASPEDLVMLAKAVEAIGGRATVFDVLDAGDEARQQAVSAIDTARIAALAEVHAAAGVTDAMLADIAALFGRLDPAHFALTQSVNPLPDAARGAYVLTTATNAAANVRLPQYAPGHAAVGCYMLINSSAFVVQVEGASGDHVGALQPHGFAVAYITGNADAGWRWQLTRSDEGGANVLFDQPVMLLDSDGTYYMQIAPTDDGFLVAWTVSNAVRLCLLRWQDGQIVPGEIVRHPTAYVSGAFGLSRLGATPNYMVLYADTTPSNQAIRAFIVSHSTAGLRYDDVQTLKTETSYTLQWASCAMFSATQGVVARGTYYSTNSQSQLITTPLTISATAVITLGTDRLVTSGANASWIHNKGQSHLAVQAGRALFMESGAAGGQLLRYFTLADNSKDVKAANWRIGSANSNGHCVSFLTDALAVIFWVQDTNNVCWRLVRLTDTDMVYGNMGVVNLAGFSGVTSPYQTLAPVVLSASKIALIAAGTKSTYPVMLMGALNADGTDISWEPAIDLPFGSKYQGLYLAAGYDADRHALLVTQHANNASPMALTVKL